MINVSKCFVFTVIITNYRRKIFAAIVVAVMGLSFAAPVFAGGSSAKSLAKQTQDLTRKAAELEKKAAEIEVKAAALSARDRRTYQEELTRLGFEPPAGLFYDPASLLGSAEYADDIAGILGGLVGLARGNDNSGTTAPSGGSSSTPAATGAPTTVGDGILSGKAGAFFNMFDGKNYHMKTKTIVEGMGMEMIGETFIKGDMIATVSEVMGMTTRSVRRDGMMYIIYDAMRTVMVMPIPASSGNPSEEPVRTSGLVLTGSGTARFDGKNLPYEEYSLSIEDGSAKTLWFLDGNNLAGFRTIVSADGITQTVDMVILALDQNVPNSVFEIPDDYPIMDISQMQQGLQIPGGF